MPITICCFSLAEYLPCGADFVDVSLEAISSVKLSSSDDDEAPPDSKLSVERSSLSTFFFLVGGVLRVSMEVLIF